MPERDAAIGDVKGRFIELTEFNAHVLVLNQEGIAGASAVGLQEEVDAANFNLAGFALFTLPKHFLFDGEVTKVNRAWRSRSQVIRAFDRPKTGRSGFMLLHLPFGSLGFPPIPRTHSLSAR
jgi:hypothetical protein